MLTTVDVVGIEGGCVSIMASRSRLQKIGTKVFGRIRLYCHVHAILKSFCHTTVMFKHTWFGPWRIHTTIQQASLSLDCMPLNAVPMRNYATPLRRCCRTGQIQHWWHSFSTTTMRRCGPVTCTIWSINWISEVPFTEFVISLVGLPHGDCHRFIFAFQHNLFPYLVLINHSTSSVLNFHKYSVCNIFPFISVTQQTKKLLYWTSK